MTQRIFEAGRDETSEPVDAILVVSFGGPEESADVLPFLRNVTRGRGVPEERLAEVAEHYRLLGGRSPLNDQMRALTGALEKLLNDQGPALPVYWGNRNWHPFVSDTLREMAADGRKHAVAFVASAYSSFSGCKQYREDIARAQVALGPAAPVIDKTRQFFNHPGFILPMAMRVREALLELPPDLRNRARLVFTAHSIPVAMARSSRYVEQLREAAALVSSQLTGNLGWDVVYQSASSSPGTAWLGPDVCDHLEHLAANRTEAVVLVPIGFISDHVEVLYDLDVEARAVAGELGLPLSRAATVGTDPRFVEAVRELICEVIEPPTSCSSMGALGPVGCLGRSCCVVA